MARAARSSPPRRSLWAVALSALLALVTVASAAATRPNLDLSQVRPARPDRMGQLDRLRRDPVLARVGTVVHVDERYGVPNLVRATPSEPLAGRAARAGSPAEAARAHVHDLAAFYQLDAADIDGMTLREVHDTGVGGIIATFDQVIDGVPVFRERMKVLMDRSYGLIAVSGHVAGHAELAADAKAFRIGAGDAIGRALEDMAGSAAGRAVVQRVGDAEGGYETYTVSGIAEPRIIGGDPIRARRVWFHLADGLVPAWYVELIGETEAAAYVIAARDGRVLMRNDLVAHDAFAYRVWADNTSLHLPLDGPQGNGPTPHPTGLPDLYSPPFVATSLVTLQNGPISTNDPWLAPGATQTSGNNVDAYADLAWPDGFSAGDLRATTTSANAFDRAYDPNQSPGASTSQQMAAITQLFYDNNILHDWFYDAGFNEAAGNAQASNYGRGGVQGDAILAEGQDYGGFNNANMTTPADGASPHMQMYVFKPTPNSQVLVNSPASIAGPKTHAAIWSNPPTINLTATVAAPFPGAWNPASSGLLSCGTGPEWVNLADVTGDGKPDLATANLSSNDVTILRGLGNGQFQAGGTFATAGGTYMVITPDLNHDAWPDLVTANFSANNISVRLGAGGGAFSVTRTDHATGAGAASVAVGRFNADANDDIVVANYGANTVSVLIGNGAGGFSSTASLAMGTQPNWVAVGDLNGDGAADIVTADAGSNTVSRRLGNGAGGFGAAASYVAGNGPLTLALGDLNGDGKLDVVTANYADNTIAVLPGNGLGGFGAATAYAVPAAPVTVTLAHLNGDGLLDAAVVCDASNSVTTFYGNGAGGLASRVDRAVGTSPYGLAIGDVSGDGNPDIVTANFGSNNCTLFLGAVTTPGAACPPYANTLTGRVALLADPFGCNPYGEIHAAELAGAVAVLIVIDGENVWPFDMSPPAGIPTYVLTQSAVIAIEGALRSGAVSVTLTQTTPLERDGTIDNQIVAHEWGHYLSQRLLGSATTSIQGAALSEGWSDFVALLTTAKPEDAAAPNNHDWQGVFAEAGYVISSTLMATNSYYFGVRRYPYCSDLSKNPLTFRHIQDAQALPGGPPVNPISLPNSEAHNAGEVWCSALWECYASLLRDTGRLTFTQARDRMCRYLVASLKLTPGPPTFLEGRDALLLAALANDSTDYERFCAAFAKRGMGTGATGPLSWAPDNAGVVESFVCGGVLTVTSVTYGDSINSCDHDGYVDDGEDGRLTVTMFNPVGSVAMNAPTMTVSSTNPKISFPNGATVPFAVSNPNGSTTASLRVRFTGGGTSAVQDLSIQYDHPALTPPGPRTLPTLYHWGNVDEVFSNAESFEALVPTWASSGPVLSAASTPWTVFRPNPTDINHAYFVADPNGQSDRWLVSPPLVVGAGNFGFTFKHTYSFEASGTNYYDGGVVEITTDGGAHWTDIGATISPGYGDTLFVSNPLGTRPAFVGTSPGYPARAVATASLGTTYANQTVQIRFRLGADIIEGAAGWTVDDLAFTGITNAPFKALVTEGAPCTPLAVDEASPTELAFTVVGANPGVGGTTFRFALPASSRVRISVFDIAGRQIATLADGGYAAGSYTARWSADHAGVGPGVYFARMVAGNRVLDRRVVVLTK